MFKFCSSNSPLPFFIPPLHLMLKIPPKAGERGTGGEVEDRFSVASDLVSDDVLESVLKLRKNCLSLLFSQIEHLYGVFDLCVDGFAIV